MTMRKTADFSVYSILLIGSIILFASSCGMDDDTNAVLPVLSTIEITDITQTTAKSGGTITSDGGEMVTARGICWDTSQNPTISESKTTDGSGTGSFSSSMTGLIPETTYYVRAYATNSTGTAYGTAVSFTTKTELEGPTLKDARDDNEYKTVQIGEQIWMAENLRYLPSVNGPRIGSTTTANYYVYGYDGAVVADAKATENYQTYGVLYNWAAAMGGTSSSAANPSGVKGACPSGWHLPSASEWKQLEDFLGGESVAGGKLKEKGTTLWNSPNEGATNETGFTAFPGGYRTYSDDGKFIDLGINGDWWSSTIYVATYPFLRVMTYYKSILQLHYESKELGLSVRCIKD